MSNFRSMSYCVIEVKFSKLLRLQYLEVGMGENFSTSLGQKSVSVSEILSERRKARACSEGWRDENVGLKENPLRAYVHLHQL